jgi:hypothetical protein
MRERLFSWAVALDSESRTGMLWNLLPYLPDDLAQRARNELRKILTETDSADRQQRRQVITGLANLTEESPEQDREALLSQAFELATIDDDDERRALAAEIHWLLQRREPQPPDRHLLLESLDLSAKNGTEPTLDFARLPPKLVLLAWGTPWAQDPRHFKQFGVLAARVAELGSADAAYDRLAKLIASLKPDALAELLQCLPAALITTRLAGYLVERWAHADASAKAEEDFAMDLGTIDKLARRLPDDAVRTIVEWDQSARPERRWTGYFSQDIAACLAPLYAQAGYLDEAQAMAAALTAHHEKARALAGIASYLPEQDKMTTAHEALALARTTGNERVQTEYQRQFAEALMKLVGATRFDDIVADSPDARTLATVASLLPAEEAGDLWEEAVTAMSGSEILDFVQAMPNDIAHHAIASIARRSADDYSGHQAPIIRAIFARIAENSTSAQFDRLVDFLAESARQGRPVLLRQFGVVAPLLLDLGGDTAISGLRQATYRVATWWP